MILYNTTFVVDTHIVDSFLQWVSTTYIPKAVGSRLLTDPLLMRVLPPAELVESSDEPIASFALQFKSADLAIARKWDDEVAPLMLNAFRQGRADESLMSFSTFMEILQ